MQYKILFLSSWYPNRVHPTNGNFIQKIPRILAKSNKIHILHVVADIDLKSSFEINTNTTENYTLTYIYFKKTNKEGLREKIVKAYKYYYYYRLGFREYVRINGKPDVVHNNVLFPVGLFALFLKFRYRIPYISSEQWTGYLDYRATKISKLRLFFTQMIARNAKIICPVTEHLQQAMQKNGILGNYEPVPNVVDQTIFYPAHHSLGGTLRFLHVSNCKEEHKNITGMLRAFDRLVEIHPNASLQIITEESVIDLEQLILQSGCKNRSNLIIKGRQPAEKIGEAMRESNCFVLFSNFETFSVVIAEAWSCGIPAIYSRCGGLTEINSPAIGIQVTKGDEQELFDALRTFSSGGIHFDRAAILNQAKEYSKYAVQEKFTTLYDQVLKD